MCCSCNSIKSGREARMLEVCCRYGAHQWSFKQFVFHFTLDRPFIGQELFFLQLGKNTRQKRPRDLITEYCTVCTCTVHLKVSKCIVIARITTDKVVSAFAIVP